MKTVWLDPMEEEEELNAFLLEEQMIMNQQQEEQQQRNDNVPPPQLPMNTIATDVTTAASTNTGAQDFISWLDTDEDEVYIPSLPGADDDDEEENLCNNLEIDHHHQQPEEEKEDGILVFNNNNNSNHQEDQTLFMDVFNHHSNPITINEDGHFPLPESPFLLDLLCNISELDIRRPGHHHQATVLEEILPPVTNHYHQPSLSCSSPPLIDQNLFFDDPHVSEFTLINNVVIENHDPVITSAAHQLVINKVTINPTAINQGDDDENNDDDDNNEQGETLMDAEGDGDGDNPNSKTMISSKTSTTSASALASTSACKNLVSERNRRKRLSQQLLALRSLVPNITKMDKRSVLVDALAYLRSLHEDITKLQNELKLSPPPPLPQSDTMISATNLALGEEASFPDNLSAGDISIPRMVARTKPKTIITEIDTEKIENQRFIVKITCKVKGENNGSSSSSSSSNRNGMGGDVLRVMESLGFEITYTSTTTTPHHLLQTSKTQNQEFLLITLFIRVRNNKHGRMTDETLRECISNRALRYGLTFQKPTTTTTTTTTTVP